MFTFKKIALLGAAGLAAFSMSCSDTNEGGEITDLKITADNTYDYYVVTGKVTGADDNKITNIKLDATNAQVGEPNATDGVEVELKAGLIVVCKDSDVGKTIKITVKVTATFESGETVEEVSKDHKCAGSSDKALTASSAVKVGGTGAEGSFVDVDPTTPKAYKGAEFAANYAKIDIIYGAGFGGGDNIYSVSNAAFEDPMTSTATVDFSLLLDLDDFSEIYSLSATEQATVKKSGVKMSDVADITTRLTTTDDTGSIPAVNGTAFAVLTADSDDFIFVVIESKNGTTDITIKSVK